MNAPDLYDLAVEPGVPLRCPAFSLGGLRVKTQDTALRADLVALAAELRGRWGTLAIGEVPGIAPVRAAYRAMGIDPTKTRPSSEALLRRILKGEDLYTVNSLVDALNLCSLRYLVPFGLYDRARVRPPVVLRRGREGEGFPGIRKEHVNVAGRACLADVEGPFGNPTSDSDRTKITLETTCALVAPFLPQDMAEERLREIVSGTAETLRKYSS